MNLLFLTPLYSDTQAWCITLIPAPLQRAGDKVVCSVLLPDKLCNDDIVSKLQLFYCMMNYIFRAMLANIYAAINCDSNNTVMS